jgi:hypothetical protein
LEGRQVATFHDQPHSVCFCGVDEGPDSEPKRPRNSRLFGKLSQLPA